tara:strand:+ start:7015 stop:7431 length:417 start_codon:yes stop_codon:yes gene_type:complete
MNKYTISKPIWDGGFSERCIGIAEFRLPCIVKISYKDKFDNLVYPDTYIVKKSEVKDCPIKTIGSISLRIIPISKLKKYSTVEDPLIKSILDTLKSSIEYQERNADTDRVVFHEGGEIGYLAGLNEAITTIEKLYESR